MREWGRDANAFHMHSHMYGAVFLSNVIIHKCNNKTVVWWVAYQLSSEIIFVYSSQSPGEPRACPRNIGTLEGGRIHPICQSIAEHHAHTFTPTGNLV